MTSLNHKFRNKIRPTDVLSFPTAMIPQPKTLPRFLGDIIICWPVCERQAKHLGTPSLAEAQRLAVHGALHLLGYDHERSAQEDTLMMSLQEKILKQLIRESLR